MPVIQKTGRVLAGSQRNAGMVAGEEETGSHVFFCQQPRRKKKGYAGQADGIRRMEAEARAATATIRICLSIISERTHACTMQGTSIANRAQKNKANS